MGCNSTVLFNNKCHPRVWDHLNRVEREERNMDRCAGVAVGDARSVVVKKLVLLGFFAARLYLNLFCLHCVRPLSAVAHRRRALSGAPFVRCVTRRRRASVVIDLEIQARMQNFKNKNSSK